MSKKLYEETNISAIASAIRLKNGSQDTYLVSEMADAIEDISTEPDLETLSVTQNGTYTPRQGKDGFSQVAVSVPPQAVLVQKSITENGTYIALDDDSADGYSEVTVSVPKGGKRLPDEYQEVEYIQNTVGTEYYETGIIPSANLQIRTIFKIIESKSDSNAILIGSRYGATFNKRFFPVSLYNSATNLRAVYGEHSSTVVITIPSKHEIIFNAVVDSITKKTIIDDYEIDSYSISNFESNSNSMWIFGAHDTNDTLAYQLTAKLYEVEFTDTSNGTVISHLIPCYRKSDNEIGLYDIINNIFRTNQGSGTMLCGPVN